MRRAIVTLAIMIPAAGLFGQYTGPRFFWDIPAFYFTAPDVSEIGSRAGIGAETAFNMAGHWGTLRAGGGSTLTIDPGSEDIPNTFVATPYLLAEGGAGLYRTNGKRCASNHQSAFTAMAVLGIRYDINTRSGLSEPELEEFGLHYLAGVELGYFFIRNMYRNTEVVLRGSYFPQLKVFSATIGFKLFINLRESGKVGKRGKLGWYRK